MQKPATFNPSRLSASERIKRYDDSRVVDRAFYWSTSWRKFRMAFLVANPFCWYCEHLVQPSRQTLAEQVDHIRPRVERPELSFDPDNCRPACASCHARYGSKRGKGAIGVGSKGDVPSATAFAQTESNSA